MSPVISVVDKAVNDNRTVFRPSRLECMGIQSDAVARR